MTILYIKKKQLKIKKKKPVRTGPQMKTYWHPFTEKAVVCPALRMLSLINGWVGRASRLILIPTPYRGYGGRFGRGRKS